jgi:Xaa-Pro dipeptidase
LAHKVGEQIVEAQEEMKIRSDLAFPTEEYRSRLGRIRQTMSERGLDALLVHTPENICYATGHHTPGYYYMQMLIVPRAGDPVLVLRRLEQRGIEAFSWLRPEQVAPYDDTENPIAAVVRVLGDMKLDRRRLGVEKSGWFLPIDKYEELVRALSRAEIVNGSGVVEKERMVKSPAEVAYIRQACRISEKGMQAVVDHCRPGMTENALAGCVHKALVENGGEWPGLPVFLSSGHRTLIPHATWSDKVIGEGDHVLVELTGVVKRYAGPLFRTFHVGPPPAKLVEHAGLVEEMLQAIIEAIRPGVTSHEVNAVVGAVTAKAGLPGVVRKRAGYSVGLNFPPDWGEGAFLDLKNDDPTVLRAGMVFHVPASLRLPEEAPVALSETVLVTESGREVLTNFSPCKLIAL